MSTTVRITDPAKSRLRRIQEAWRRVRGESPTQQEVLERGLDFVDRHFEQFVAETAWRPFQPEELSALRRRQGHYGAWSVKDLDDVVYGDAA